MRGESSIGPPPPRSARLLRTWNYSALQYGFGLCTVCAFGFRGGASKPSQETVPRIFSGRFTLSVSGDSADVTARGLLRNVILRRYAPNPLVPAAASWCQDDDEALPFHCVEFRAYSSSSGLERFSNSINVTSTLAQHL